MIVAPSRILALLPIVVVNHFIVFFVTGEGVRETLRMIRKRIPLEMHEVPSGTNVFDWTVPLEWNVSDAYIKNEAGVRVVDFKANNLHVMSYSSPLKKRMTLEQLNPHLFSLPDHPEWIPYRTSYYQENWGFCLSHKKRELLENGEYEVMIDSTLLPGSLTYGESYLQGETVLKYDRAAVGECRLVAAGCVSHQVRD